MLQNVATPINNRTSQMTLPMYLPLDLLWTNSEDMSLFSHQRCQATPTFQTLQDSC